jgi:ABC-type anion transport system duplicated permease subunit
MSTWSQIKKRKALFASKQATISNKSLLASYKVAYRVAKCKNAEELVLPCAMDIVKDIPIPGRGGP